MGDTGWCSKGPPFSQPRCSRSCLGVEPVEPGGGLRAKRTHLTVFTAQSVGAHGIGLQGARAGIAAEVHTFLQRGVGFT